MRVNWGIFRIARRLIALYGRLRSWRTCRRRWWICGCSLRRRGSWRIVWCCDRQSRYADTTRQKVPRALQSDWRIVKTKVRHGTFAPSFAKLTDGWRHHHSRFILARENDRARGDPDVALRLAIPGTVRYRLHEVGKIYLPFNQHEFSRMVLCHLKMPYLSRNLVYWVTSVCEDVGGSKRQNLVGAYFRRSTWPCSLD